ncbi:MAG: Lrp/AsnC family transcriptional regulator [Sphingomonadales bacterium]
MKSRTLDQTDLEILAILQEDGRITNRNLAEQVGLSPSPCLERVRRLQDQGFIKRFTAVIDVEKLYDPVFVYAQITLGNQGRGQQAQIEDHLRGLSQIVQLVEVSGDCDYIAHFVCPSIADYQKVTATLLDSENLAVERIVSHVVMRNVKEATGLPLERGFD